MGPFSAIPDHNRRSLPTKGAPVLRKRKHAAIYEACPNCVYCGGLTAATTVDHMPPRAMFYYKLRPKGLEFASCEACNQGTKHADLVASLMARAYPNPPKGEEQTEDLFEASKNNIP